MVIGEIIADALQDTQCDLRNSGQELRIILGQNYLGE